MSTEPHIDAALNSHGQLVLKPVNAPAGVLIRYAMPWERKRVLFMNGPYLAPVDPLPGMEIRFRLFDGQKGISEVQSFVFPGCPLDPSPSTALVPCTQNRDFLAYRWEERHLAAVEAVKRDGPRLLFLGDSITHFFGGIPVDPVLLEYQRMAPDIWDESFGRWNPVNLGFGNDRVENVLWRVRHGELDGAAPDALCVILIGTNNMKVNTDEEIVEGIACLCREILNRLPQGRIMLQGIYPRVTRPERVPVINGMLAALDIPGVCFRTPGSVLADADELPLPGMTHDGIHPTREGYARVARELVREISELIS